MLGFESFTADSYKSISKMILFFRWVDCDAPVDASSIPEANNTKVDSSVVKLFQGFGLLNDI